MEYSVIQLLNKLDTITNVYGAVVEVVAHGSIPIRQISNSGKC